jgi:hypothetical protein
LPSKRYTALNPGSLSSWSVALKCHQCHSKSEYSPPRPSNLKCVQARAVLGVHGRGHELLLLVAAEPVAQHHVRVHLDARRLRRADGPKVLVLGAVLGAHGALLVELAQVVEVVDAVPDVRAPARALVGGRQPYRGEPGRGQLLRAFLKLTPERPVVRQEPMEELQHHTVHVVPLHLCSPVGRA